MSQPRFVSTRGGVPPAAYENAILSGLAGDGGLFTLKELPHVSKEWLRLLRGGRFDYRTLSLELSSLLDGDSIPVQDRRRIINDAFSPDVWGKDPAPVKRLERDVHIMELWHGPSAAFKDLPMQPVGREFNYLLQKRGERKTVVVATSGDTGPAAIEAFRGSPNVDIVVLFPIKGTSPFQGQQISTPTESNVFPVGIEGVFDDCQALVKVLFRRPELVERLKLSGVNSINWGRIRSQIVYYFHLWGQIARDDDEIVTIIVPAGNFGNALAGYFAQETGLPIRIVIATNTNRMLTDFIGHGLYKPASEVVPTISPSMDINVSSNIERLLFRITGNDPSAVVAYMKQLAEQGYYQLRPVHMANLRATGIRADWASESECKDWMYHVYKKYGYIIDPHTAAAYAVFKKMTYVFGQVVILSTASPIKFEDAVRSAGITAELERPAKFIGIEKLPRPRLVTLPANADAVEAYLREHLKAA